MMALWYSARPERLWTRRSTRPSFPSKTSYSTGRASLFDQFPGYPCPSILTRNRRLWAWAWSGIVSSSAQVGQEAGALPIDQQFCLQPGPDLVVELASELIHVRLVCFVACQRGGDAADRGSDRASDG